MNLIEKLSKEAHERGMSYGKYVATLPVEEIIKPKPLQKGERVCIKCGERYMPGVTKSGNRCTNKKCPKCRGDVKKAYEAQKKRTTKKQLKEYHRVCAICGAEVITTQPPRESIPIYCLDCRDKERKRKQHEYWLIKKGLKNGR